MSRVDLSNSRDPEQRQRMERLLIDNVCHFCREGFEKRHSAPIIYETDFWFIAANNYPYNGTIYHYLIIPKVHIKKYSEMTDDLSAHLTQAVYWLENHLNVSGYSIFVRSGDTRITCATLEHLHVHFVVGDKKIGDSPNKTEDLIIAPVGFKKKIDPRSA